MVVDGDDELMIVVAVENLDIDACVGHGPAELSDLAGLVVVEAMHN